MPPTDVDNFLNTLETSLSTRTDNSERSKKRMAPSDVPPHPPKRRAFGLQPSEALVIDISDDDTSDGEDAEEESADEVSTEPAKPTSRIVQIKARPALTHQVPNRRIVLIYKEVANTLKTRELAIEAMKRKIEAKMKSRGSPASHEGLAQEIAVTAVDRNEGTPAVSPLIRNAEARKDAWIDSPSNISPIPSEGQLDSDPESRTPFTTISFSERNIADPSDSPITTSVLDNTGVLESTVTVQQTPIPVDTPIHAHEDDEEARLLAELETERLAEEKARRKRRELEDRLTNARGKKLHRSASAISERVGTGDQAETVRTVKDSTSSLF